VHHPYPMHFYSPAEIVQLAVKAGFAMEQLDGDIVVVARKAGGPAWPPEVTERLDFSLLEGDTMLGLATRHRQAVDRAWELEEALERIRRHPLLRAGRLLLGRPRRARGG